MDAADDGWLVAGSADPIQVGAYYDAWAEHYDTDLHDWAYRAPQIVARMLLDHRPDASTVLDAGCGTGLVGRALRSAGFRGEIHGIDLSQASLTIARRSGHYDRLAGANLQDPLAFDDDSFDALTCVGVMTYLPDVEACWREFSRIVRPGGAVVVTQRQDLWESRHCRQVVDMLVADHVWEAVSISDAQPYLPDNGEFADQIGVHYVAAIVLDRTAARRGAREA